MDLKQLLNQTNIKEKDSTTQQQDTDIDKPETNDLDNQDNDNQTPLIISSSEEEPEVTLDSRFAQPWNKLEKGSKMNRILVFVQSQKTENGLTDNQTKELKNLLFKACENGLFNKISDVKYNEEIGEIESFKHLEFNESSKKYKLKTGGTKNRSVSKSRSNIDRLTKKK